MKEHKFIEKVNQEFKSEIESISVNQDLLMKIKEENSKKKQILPLWFKSPVWSYAFGLATLLFATL